MEKLLRITEKIVALRDISKDSMGGLREYKLEQGTAFSSTIHQSDDIAIAIGFFSKGSIFPFHNHGATVETLTVYKGELTVITEKESKVLKPGDSYILQPGEGHMLRVHEDTKMLITTIPPDFEAVAKIEKAHG